MGLIGGVTLILSFLIDERDDQVSTNQVPRPSYSDSVKVLNAFFTSFEKLERQRRNFQAALLLVRNRRLQGNVPSQTKLFVGELSGPVSVLAVDYDGDLDF